MVVIHDLNPELLARHKQTGSVRNRLDRQRDLYRIHFTNGDETIEV